MKTTVATLNPCLRDLLPPRMVEILPQPLPNKHLVSLMPSSPTSIRKLAVKITRLFKSKLTYLLRRLQVRTIKWAMAKKRKSRSLQRTTPMTMMTTTHNPVSNFFQFCSVLPPHNRFVVSSDIIITSVTTESSLSNHHGSTASPQTTSSHLLIYCTIETVLFLVCFFFFVEGKHFSKFPRLNPLFSAVK